MSAKAYIFRMRQHILIFALACGLFACGGAKDSELTREREQLIPPEVNSNNIPSGSLTQSTPINVERFIKNGVYANSVASQVSEPSAASARESDAFTSDAVASDDSFSGTNTIEQGVDEADRVKYDGTYMYIAERGTNLASEERRNNVRVLKRNDDYTLESLPSLQPSVDFSTISDLYLHDETVAIAGVNNPPCCFIIDAATSVYAPSSNKILLSFFDISDPANGQELTAYTIDGYLNTTRRIGDDLYIVSTYNAYINDLPSYAVTDEEKQANYTAVLETPIEDLMPKLYKDGQTSLLNQPENCYIPAQATNVDGNSQFIHVTKISLTDPNSIESLCLSAYSSLVYMSTDSLYMVASDYFSQSTLQGMSQSTPQTIFHKIDLASFDYVASGAVEGVLGWRGHPGFRMDEAEGQLRIVTTDYNQSPMKHTLHVLNQDGSELTTIATLPNEQSPEAIGKPGEDIYAVRFIDEKAYIVTFEQIDPLYVINLADGSNPFIEGSLEIPGFSSYIHPLDNGYLLGVGQQVTLPQLAPQQPDVMIAPITSGMKVSLFDVRDPSNPLEITNIVVPNAYTPVEYEYKALSVLNISGSYQFALPFHTWSQVIEVDMGTISDSVVAQSNEGLMLLETNTNALQPNLDLSKNVFAPTPSEWFHYTLDNRSIIQGDKVYFIRGDEVYLTDWNNSEERNVVLGPF